MIDETADPRAAFIEAAVWHGALDRAEALLTAHPDLRSSDIHTSAILGDAEAVGRFLARDAAEARATSPPYGGNALVYLALSKYLRLQPERGEAFLHAATALLDAGADPNSGFWTTGPHPEFETALYGAAGVAHHGPLTRLLLERGADPNDVEAVYHSPEDWDLEGVRALVESNRLTADSLATMLVRKHDWHDEAGVAYLLSRGADPNHPWRDGGHPPLHHAIARDNDVPIFELLLEHGADPAAAAGDVTAIELAARRGRGDLLALFESRGCAVEPGGVVGLIAAAARGDRRRVMEVVEGAPALADAVLAEGGRLLVEFAGNANADGVALLLDLGIPVDARFMEGDGYWGLAPESTALHNAAWRMSHEVLRLLLARGAAVEATDARGRTPLMLALKACVDSYWRAARSTEAIEALLAAGASAERVPLPTGYEDADLLLRAARGSGSS